MKVAKVSQHDQITALTRGASLPLAPVGQDVLTIILESIAEAWEHLKAHYPVPLKAGKEADISALLVTRLNETLNSDPLLSTFVSSVERGSETVTYDGTKIEVRPDLQFSLTRQDRRFRLVGEAKIIDIPKKKTPALYRNNGIARFVDGDYAWASREGLMVAYVRCNASLDPDLLPGLGKFAQMQCNSHWLAPVVKPPMAAGSLATTRHNRTFGYVHCASSSPGAIELWHLWLHV